MKIGSIGAGNVAQAIARHAASQGHQVVLSNSRGPASLTAVTEQLGSHVNAGTREEAASAEVVVLAVGWPQVPDAVAGLPPFGGRIVIDTTNQFASPSPRAEIVDLGPLRDGGRLMRLGGPLSGLHVLKQD